MSGQKFFDNHEENEETGEEERKEVIHVFLPLSGKFQQPVKNSLQEPPLERKMGEKKIAEAEKQQGLIFLSQIFLSGGNCYLLFAPNETCPLSSCSSSLRGEKAWQRTFVPLPNAEWLMANRAA